MIRLRAHTSQAQSIGGYLNVDNATTIEAHGGADSSNDGVDDVERYRLLSIDSVRTPEGCVGRDWHVYRIAQGENGITGYRCGDLARVRLDVEAIVTALNDRRHWAKSKESAKRHRPAPASAAK